MTCEECGEESRSVYPRPDLGFRSLCAKHNMLGVRKLSPTGLTNNDECIVRELHQFYLDCGIEPADAFEKLAYVLARAPAMFTRLIGVLDELRSQLPPDEAVAGGRGL